MIKSEDYTLAWEKRVSPFSAHINLQDNYFSVYAKAMDRIKMDGKTVIDYGCGGGWIGKYLFDEKKIKAYLGIDIAKRSIEAAEQNLADYENKVFLLVDPNALPDFSQMKADFFISLSCIQHFPDKEYLDYFLNAINNSEIKTLILQVKYSNKTIFREHPYKTTHDIGNGCFTNFAYMQSKLTNYKGTASDAKTEGEYQYMRFKLIGNN